MICAPRYFAPRYFAPRYFGTGQAVVGAATTGQSGGRQVQFRHLSAVFSHAASGGLTVGGTAGASKVASGAFSHVASGGLTAAGAAPSGLNGASGGHLALVGSLHTRQPQTLTGRGAIDRYARARREDELWLMAA